MPFYEYQCKSCGHELEAMQKVSDSPLKKCPHCGKSQLTRLMSAPVFRLKGGGWYETDFKDDKDRKRNLADRPEAEAAKDSKDSDVKAEKGKEEAKSTDAKTAEAGSVKETGAAKESGGAGKETSGDKSADKKPAAAAGKTGLKKSAARVGRPARRKPPAKVKRRR
jgi:putative FmdB family regulatory protein